MEALQDLMFEEMATRKWEVESRGMANGEPKKLQFILHLKHYNLWPLRTSGGGEMDIGAGQV